MRCLRIPRDSVDGRELRMCTAFSNAGPLPLLFVDSLFAGPGLAGVRAKAVSVISFYLLAWSPMFWVVGRSILSPSAAAASAAAGAAGAAAERGGEGWLARARRVASSEQTARLLPPPLLGCVLGAFAGGTAAGRALFVSSGAPLRPVLEAMGTLGQVRSPTRRAQPRTSPPLSAQMIILLRMTNN